MPSAASSQEAPETLDWRQARRAAFIQDVLAVLGQRQADLLAFEEVRQKLHLGARRELGLQEVPLDHIVGSVGRYQDFTRAFFPRRDDLQARWRRIDQLVSAGRPLPPVELYKVGQVYFVRDGNHRVSVARQHKFSTIAAYVWECETELSLEPDTDIDKLLCKTAHAEFMERTHLEQLYPQPEFRLTQPHGYQDLLTEIEAFQQVLCQIDARDVPFDEAVTLWYEMRYMPVVNAIRQQYVLQEFPGRTETDLYLWLCRNQAALQSSYEGRVMMEEAAEDLAKRFSPRRLPIHPLRKALGWLVARLVSWTIRVRSALQRRLSRILP